MLLFPIVGRKCWAVLDWWETFCAVPVTIIPADQAEVFPSAGKGDVTARWVAGEFYTEDYVFTRRQLYRSRKKAEGIAQKLNRQRQEGGF